MAGAWPPGTVAGVFVRRLPGPGKLTSVGSGRPSLAGNPALEAPLWGGIVGAVRAVFVLADVLRADEAAVDALGTLDDAGLRPVVLQPHALPDGQRPDTGGYPVVSCDEADDECWGDEPALVLDAARRTGSTPREAFMVCTRVEDLTRADEAGCRPVLILAGRSLDDVFGPRDPDHKAAACAPDMATAARFMVEEARQSAALGAFPYAGGSTLDERARAAAPSPTDLTRIMAAVVIAGLALALGAAYLLQEVYKVYTFPPAVYWLTLQFIPQTWRAALFLAIGAAAAVIALMGLDRWPVRRRTP